MAQERDGRSEIDDLVAELLGEDEHTAMPVDHDYVASRLAAVTAHMRRHHLAGLTIGEIESLGIQQARWEATAYAAAEEILRRARQEIGDEAWCRGRVGPAPAAVPVAAREAAEPPDYRGRHEAPDDPPEAWVLSATTRYRLRAVRGRGNFRGGRRDGIPQVRVRVVPDALDQLRPRLWHEMVQWVHEVYPVNREVTYQLVDAAFELARNTADAVGDDEETVRTWVRRCAQQILDEDRRRRTLPATATATAGDRPRPGRPGLRPA
jgi:hypothetical protein